MTAHSLSWTTPGLREKFCNILKQNEEDWYDYYLPTERNDRVLETIIKNGRALVTGSSGLGKTRLVIEVLRKLVLENPEYRDMLMVSVEPSRTIGDVPILRRLSGEKWKLVVLLFDDLDKFIPQAPLMTAIGENLERQVYRTSQVDLNGLILRFEEVSERVVYIATCRSEELAGVDDRAVSVLFRKAEIVHLPDLSDDEGRRMARGLDKEFPKGFSGTADHIVLDTLRKAEYYENELNEHEKSVLRAVKLLRRIGIGRPKVHHVRAAWNNLFHPSSQTYYSSWDTCFRKVSHDYRFFSVSSDDVSKSDLVLIPDVFMDDKRGVARDYPSDESRLLEHVRLMRDIFADERSINELFQIGVFLGRRGLHEGALDCFNLVVTIIKEVKQESSEVYYNRGIAYYELGKHERAIEDYNMALKLDPENARAYYNRGNAYYELGKHERAIDDLEIAWLHRNSLPDKGAKIFDTAFNILEESTEISSEKREKLLDILKQRKKEINN